jgi:PLD-like domain
MRVKVVAVFLCLCILVFAPPAYPITPRVTPIDNRAYGNAVLQAIDNAKESVYVAMYSMYLTLGEAANPALLVNALIAAKNRGVQVKVYLDNTPDNAQGNQAAYKLLKDAGVEVYFIAPAYKLHAKLIIIDDATTIEGSSNWTQEAIENNFEVDVSVDNGDFAKKEEAFFAQLDAHTVPVADTPRELLEKVKIKNQFLDDARLASQMAKVNDEHAFNLYLWLLRKCKENREKVDWVNIDYVQMADYLGIRVDKEKSKYRFDVRFVVKHLKDDYGLVDYRLDAKDNLSVKLTDYTDKAKDYIVPQAGYLNLPLAYWDYGLDKQLGVREKFAYLICIYESEIARPKTFWWEGLTNMAKKYHIGREALIHGFAALEEDDLIAVRRARFAPGKGFNQRDANEYSLLPLLSPKLRAQQWASLEKKYGKDTVDQARLLALVWKK